jgi:hypothetical protein
MFGMPPLAKNEYAAFGAGQTMIAFLSVYLLLFGFFALLFSQSSIDPARKVGVLSSLASAFQGDDALDNSLTAADKNGYAYDGDFFETISELVADLDLGALRTTENGRIVFLELNEGALFVGGTRALMPEAQEYFSKVVEILDDPNARFSRRATIVAEVEETLRLSDWSQSAAVRRAVGLVGKLNPDGAGAHRLQIETRTAETAGLSIVFFAVESGVSQ